jgi:glycosyltransferase involved in cell wall biosynthesis
MVNKPELSVIMAAYNSARFIGEALASLQAERDIAAEFVVIVDDRSIDGTDEIVARLAQEDERIRQISIDRPGVTPALNAGLEVACGEYITFLDSDDLCPPGRIARQIGKLAVKPSLGAIAGEVLIFKELGEDMEPVPGSQWARVLSPCLGACTFRRAAISAVGRFDEGFTHSSDIDFMLRLHESDWLIEPENELGLLCRKHETNVSSDPAAVQSQLLKALQHSIARRRQSGHKRPLPFALMKPLSEIRRSENGFPGHRTIDLFKRTAES